MKHSYRKINYSLRPAKCIERKMLCETFRRISPFGSIDSFRYIGFGSTYFSDFVLFHKELNIKNMLSIEKDQSNRARFNFNLPFHCIDIAFDHSNEVLPSINWEARTILWLDYDGRLDGEVLTDIKFFCTNALPGSIVIVSVNVEPESFEAEAGIEVRLDKLKDAVGEEKIPPGVQAKDLVSWGTAKVCRRIISNEIAETLSHRNGARAEGNKIRYCQLFNFHYSDGAKMLTVGGIIYDQGQEAILAQCSFSDLFFVKPSDEAYKIDVPNLTLKEIRCLDEQLPKKMGETPSLPNVPESDISKYEKLYRYFPRFTEANL